MISVSDALTTLLDLVAPLEVETVPLRAAARRVLAKPVSANRDQPPFAASAMDGYAVKAAEVERDAMFKVIGESAAGHGFQGRVGPGQAVRIFTGAPVPEGADFVVIQEDTSVTGSLLTITDHPGPGHNIRAKGGDFQIGTSVDAPRMLTPADIALLAAMNIAEVPVHRKPTVALISTGDELVMPGESPGPDQIIASNTFGLDAMLSAAGAECRILPIARDTEGSLRMALDLAQNADLVVTIGGASVGDHDLVAGVTEGLGMSRAFYKVAMRPGKPLMAGTLGRSAMVGLPGNPVSAMVCGHVFLLPMLRMMQGLSPRDQQSATASLAHDLPVNGPRTHYMRAKLSGGNLHVFDDQDSARLTLLSEANALAIRPPHDPPRSKGEPLAYIVI
ncbi:gephyrin-like molybdotransferase Glp [Phaeobacter gallaeciensis]|uniref:molybdopterin molybdotransferase MoeA n=1 Tax=Phaeobacter gallaeciensis TaxID=60890 RepID=UPI000BBBAD96|nr:gephyrin-like molybdotransferase Glp [Phaeobacter gallaeciensis]ATF18265.1 molybdopterin biosynthesis protein MoeA [Phaeobacter gallaeciensis]ATF22374.1 molybdopterin biosynthesis protein MoeA [Phaeobacter gallaeciensis]